MNGLDKDGPYASHNGFLMVLGRFGIVGLLVYLALLVYIVVEIIKSAKVRGDGWIGVLLAVLVAVLIHSLFEDTVLLDFRLKGMMTLGIIWIPVGISKRDYEDKKSQETKRAPEDSSQIDTK